MKLFNYTQKLFLVTFLCYSFFILPISCQERPQPIYIIDIPTADIVAYGGYSANFRLYGKGGIVSRASFGVLPPINMGISFDINGLMGTGNRVYFRPPAILFKARFYEGGIHLPAFAIGYDGQGYGEYNESTDKYTQREKGLYLVATKEIIAPGLDASCGGNMYDFDKQRIVAFLGLTYNIEDKLLLLTDYDNIKSTPENRWNIGLRIFLTPNIHIEASGRDMLKGSKYTERVLRIGYTGAF